MQTRPKLSRLQINTVCFNLKSSVFVVFVNPLFACLRAQQPAAGITNYIALNDTRPPEGQGERSSLNLICAAHNTLREGDLRASELVSLLGPSAYAIKFATTCESRPPTLAEC